MLGGAALAPLGASGKPASGLRQLHAPGGCYVNTFTFPRQGPIKGCRNDVRGVRDAEAAAISPDGRSLYVASEGYPDPEPTGGSLAAFRRDRARGTIGQPGGAEACVVDVQVEPIGGCRNDGHGMLTPSDVAVSPDGRNVYTASDGEGSIASFARNRRSGTLTQLPGLDACFEDRGPFEDARCRKGRAIGGAFAIALSPDGKNLYATTFFGLAIFSRDESTGRLTQLPGHRGCIASDVLPAPGCAVLDDRIAGAGELVVSPDGRDVYVGTEGSTSQGLPSRFKGAVLGFRRDRGDGSLRLRGGRGGCLVDRRQADLPLAAGCRSARALLEPTEVAISPSGGHLYALPQSPEAITVMTRGAGGGLHQPSGRRGCVVPALTPRRKAHRCAREIHGATQGLSGMAISGRTLYAVGGANNTVAVFERRGRSGALDQLGGHDGCVGKPCGRPVKGLDLPGGAVASPDGRFLYVLSEQSIAALKRE